MVSVFGDNTHRVSVRFLLLFLAFLSGLFWNCLQGHAKLSGLFWNCLQGNFSKRLSAGVWLGWYGESGRSKMSFRGLFKVGRKCILHFEPVFWSTLFSTVLVMCILLCMFKVCRIFI